MDEGPPKLTIAAETSEGALAKREALDELRWPTREMVANLMRVMRGAGDPCSLPDQVISLALAIQEAGQHQSAQRAAGEREMHEGVEELERAWERNREEARQDAIEYAQRWEQAQRRRKQPSPKTKKPTARKAARPESEPEIEHTGSTAEFMKKRGAQLARATSESD